MRNVLRVAVREYRENVQTKAFWLGIFILPALLGASIALPLLFEKDQGRASLFRGGCVRVAGC